MAKIPFGILGPFIGKVGPVIGYMRGETWCVRSVPAHYRDARTVAQLRNRGKLTRLMGFLCSMKAVIRSSFDVWNSDNPCRTEFNMAFAENFHTALRTTARGTEILYHKVRVADGLLAGLTGAEAYRDGDVVHVCWSVLSFATGMDNSRVAPSPADRLCLCAHNAETGESVWNLCAGLRQDGRAVFAIPEGWNDGSVHLWAWFASGVSSSASVYLGQFGQVSVKQGLFELSDYSLRSCHLAAPRQNKQACSALGLLKCPYPGTSCHPSQEGTRLAGWDGSLFGFDTDLGRTWYGFGSTLIRRRAIFGLGKGDFGLGRGVFGEKLIRGPDIGGRNGPWAYLKDGFFGGSCTRRTFI